MGSTPQIPFLPLRLGSSSLRFLALPARGGRLARAAVAEVEIGTQYTGKVANINEFGATLDLGEGVLPGWLNIGQIQDEKLDKVESALTVGQEVTVRVKKVERRGTRLDVTMLDLPMFSKKKLSEYKPGEEVQGVVTSATNSAVFVDIGAMIDGYLPKNEIESPSDLKEMFKPGQQLKAEIRVVTPTRLEITTK